jgi:uncharacterized membrane protein YkvA (DUF1232 family)
MRPARSSARPLFLSETETSRTTSRLRRWAARLKRDVIVIWLAARDPRVPWPAKLLALAVAGYAFSPIDLIPDFIPVLGLLDDLILVPLGVWLVLRMIPPDIVADLRLRAQAIAQRPRSTLAAAVIILLWFAIVGTVAYRFLIRSY